MKKILSSELILNPDGSIYHIKLKPEQIADDIILVGDPGRVEVVSSFFDEIQHKVHNREFATHTGIYKGKRITCISSGIGTDNIDIVVNELDALANIDLDKRVQKKSHRSLNLIRIGTSGALQEDIPVDSYVLSDIAVGFDGTLNFYAGRNSVSLLDAEAAFKQHVNWDALLNTPYFVKASDVLKAKIGKGLKSGITISSNGFYGPQGRVLRLPLRVPELNEKMRSFEYDGLKITNYEMESSAIYGLARMLGHNALTICAIIANRYNKQSSKDYHPAVEKLIKRVLDKLVDD
ncbi:MAG: nucleoside phosphorylase [Bacteroidales bacterium]